MPRVLCSCVHSSRSNPYVRPLGVTIMDALAVAQSKARLLKAEKSLEALKMATKIEDAEEAWTDFLLAASTIYAKLEQGSKGHAKSQAWFGHKKKERKEDPLLRYLHFARNSDEHGIERVSATTGENNNLLEGGRKLRFNERFPVKLTRIDEKTRQPIGETTDAVLAGPTLKPVRVYDRRFDDFCEPPTTHRGRPITYSDFLDGIAATALGYLRELVGEAEAFVNRDSVGMATKT